MTKLLGVNTTFSDRYYSATEDLAAITLKQTLSLLSKKYICPEIISIP
ncbi:hypothetical protein Rin_00018160, partial [Candidatus Regiella insecticola 5.15]